MALAWSARDSWGFSHLIVTLASTTSLGTVLKLLTTLQDTVSQTYRASGEPLAKGLHLSDKCAPPREFFWGEDVRCRCLRLDCHRDPDPIGERHVFIQDHHIAVNNSLILHPVFSCVTPSLRQGTSSLPIDHSTLYPAGDV